MPTDTEAPPSTLTSFGDFQTLQPGSVIMVNDTNGSINEWTKLPDGRWQMDALPPIRQENFRSSVNAGRVVVRHGNADPTVTPPNVPGVLYRGVGGTLFMLVGPTTVARLTYQQDDPLNLPVAAPTFSRLIEVGPEWAGQMTYVVNRPVWADAVLSYLTPMVTARTQVAEAQARQAELLQRQVMPTGLVDALYAYAASVDDGEFDELLDNYGVSRTREHTSVVRVTGRSYWTPDGSECRGWDGYNNVEITDVEDSVIITWTATTRVTKEGFGCTCDSVDTEDYQGLLDSLPEYDDYDTEVECDTD